MIGAYRLLFYLFLKFNFDVFWIMYLFLSFYSSPKVAPQ